MNASNKQSLTQKLLWFFLYFFFYLLKWKNLNELE